MKGCAFMNLCCLYIRLCPDKFPNDKKKMYWVLSSFKKDCAATWANSTLHWVEHHGCQCHMTWAKFIKDYISHFCPLNERTTVMIKLETRQYYQNKHDVEEYINEFEELVDMFQYKDSLTIVLKSCCGLNTMIQDKVVELGTNYLPMMSQSSGT
jgi:hypothetical protein